ncbi:hypothetical protein [Sphingopyxis sp. BSNA05]|uniref:hypothetical protein n=1 Tax=Sphingopyxis sp. BSNA05 TaxID=1236614 RepID=UPI0015655B60|nr:hypothetical protein [Sphingopyxis sp. BSNA05]
MIKATAVSLGDVSRPFVLILGMHRSGTSCLAGALERCGLHLGDVRRTGTHNKRDILNLASWWRCMTKY